MKPVFLLNTLHQFLTQQSKKIAKICLLLMGLLQISNQLHAQTSHEMAHSILPADGIIQYLPTDTTEAARPAILATHKLQFTPQVNFYFLPEGTLNYKGAGMAVDTGHLNFYLRGDFGAKLSLPKNVDMVFSLQSYGIYTRSLGPLDPNLTLYEGYVDLKKLDRNGNLSLRFGRMSLGKYGNEILVGDDDFIKGRSFESVRLRYKKKRVTSDLMWVQLYQPAPPAANFDWNHPIFLATFNTFNFSREFNIDANLPFIIDQYNSGWRTSVFMPDFRAFGQFGNFKYSAEIILQTGTAKGILNENLTGTLNAYATELSAGYTSTDGKLNTSLAYYRASGDDNTSDNNLESYNVLWQNEHRRFGYIDAFKGSNVQATTLHLDWKLGRLVSTGVHGVIAQVLEPKDRSSGVVTLENLNRLNTTSKFIGIGGDWYLNYYYNHNLNFQFSTSAFQAGEYFTAVNGTDKTMIRFYLMMALRI